MYLPDHFREDRVEILHALIERHPLGALVVTVDGRPEANHVPMLLDRAGGALGTLAGHVARANPLWRNVADGTEVLVIFGGADSYVSPSSYPSKKTDGRVVPTWNYAVAHVHGRIRFFDDHGRLHALVSALTGRHEAGQSEPWAVTDAPPAYVDAMLRAIVGFEIEIAKIEGKFKASQNRSGEDRASVRERLRESLGEADLEDLVRDPVPRAG